MEPFVYIVNEVVALIAFLIALVYGAFAKTWMRALLVVLLAGTVSSVIGIYEIILAADGKESVLACFTFPISLLIIASIARAIKLAARPSQTRKYTKQPPPMPPL